MKLCSDTPVCVRHAEAFASHPGRQECGLCSRIITVTPKRSTLSPLPWSSTRGVSGKHSFHCLWLSDFKTYLISRAVAVCPQTHTHTHKHLASHFAKLDEFQLLLFSVQVCLWGLQEHFGFGKWKRTVEGQKQGTCIWFCTGWGKCIGIYQTPECPLGIPARHKVNLFSAVKKKQKKNVSRST